MRWIVLSIGVLSIVAAAGVAQAKDYCLTWVQGGSVQRTLVGKDAKLPGKGKCKPFVGFESTLGIGAAVWSGAACANADRTLIQINLTSGPGSSDSVGRFLQIDLHPPVHKGDLPSGGVWETFVNIGQATNGTAVTLTNAEKCDGGALPR